MSVLHRHRSRLPILLGACLSMTVAAQETAPYRTPRAGEAVKSTLFGEPFELAERDRSTVLAIDATVHFTPDVSDNSAQLLPYLYYWDRPRDGSHWLRAVVGGIYNDVEWATPFESGSSAEWALGFTSYSPLGATAEFIDGRLDRAEELHWGFVRARAGVGFRKSIGPGEVDNVHALDLFLEPGYLYFGRGDRTASAFDMPDSTLETRVRLSWRYDAVRRNLIERAHEGHAFGADVVYGRREDWSSWGLAGGSGIDDGKGGRDYAFATAYALLAAPSPFTDSERHRLVTTAHIGFGDGIDRFSAPRIGGGPDTRSEEVGSIARPVLPGSAVEEFFPTSYALTSISYRYELSFFAYLEAGATFGVLDRDRQEGAVRVRRDDTFEAVHLLLTSGFLGQSRLQLGYAYDFDVVRDGEDGGHAFSLRVTKTF
ncbi:MAG: hypothetical protein AB7I19_06080 [Planctomycetota bacterium]